MTDSLSCSASWLHRANAQIRGLLWRRGHKQELVFLVAGETKSIERTPSCYTCGQNQRHGEIDLLWFRSVGKCLQSLHALSGNHMGAP